MNRGTVQGGSLATTLMVAALVITLAFAAVDLSVDHLQVLTRLANARQAHNLAESALAAAVEKVISNPGFGVSRQPSDNVRVQVPDGSALVTFDSSQGTGWSTNNLNGDSAVPGWEGRVVPGQAAHLVASASYRGVTRRMEAMVAVPPFPYVVAAAGPIRSSGGLQIGAVSDPARWSPGMDPHLLEKAKLVSNQAGAGSVALGPSTFIQGDLRSCGEVVVDPRANVQGTITQWAAPVALPNLDLARYDPTLTGKPGVQNLVQGILPGANLQGFVRREGSLRLDGALILNGALLFVNGNLDARGGIRGTGAVVVIGKALVGPGSRLSTDNVAALACGQGARFYGGGGARGFFQGLVYSEGDVRAQDVTVLGSMLVTAPAGSTGRPPCLELRNSELVSSPQYARVVVSVSAPSPNLFFEPSGRLWELGDNAGGQTPVGLIIQPNPDGTFAVTDPASGVRVDNLSRTQAVDQVATFLIAHNAIDVNREDVYSILGDLSAAIIPPSVAPPAPETVTVDPNQFVGLRGKARVVLWRDL